MQKMKMSRYTPEQVVYALKQVENGMATVAETCRKLGISEATFYNWKNRHAEICKQAKHEAVEYVKKHNCKDI